MLDQRLEALKHLVFRIGARFIADQCMQRASALAYASLLAFVPLLALGFSIFAKFQAFENLSSKIQALLLQHLLPASQEAVQHYLSDLASRTTSLSVFGIIGLLITAMALIQTAEKSFNHIWRVHRHRSWLAKFTAFWSTFTLAPVFIGASITLTSYFMAIPFLRNMATSTLAFSKYFLPWIMSSLALATMYMVLPNTKVRIRYALIAGLVAGALFELGKLGFAFYIRELAYYPKVYGALAALPIFLIWLYLAWIIVLIGVETTYCLQCPEEDVDRKKASPYRMFHFHYILVQAAKALEAGKTLNVEELAQETGLARPLILEYCQELSEKGLLRQVVGSDGEGWVPGVDPEKLSLARIWEALAGEGLEIPENMLDAPLGRRLAGLFHRVKREREALLQNISLASLSEREEAH